MWGLSSLAQLFAGWFLRSRGHWGVVHALSSARQSVSGVWNWIFKHSYPLLHCQLSFLSSTLCFSPTWEGNTALEISPGMEVQRCLPPAHVLGSTKGLFPLKPTATCLWARLWVSLFPSHVLMGAGEVWAKCTQHRGARCLHPQLFLQAPQLCKPGSLPGSGVQDIRWWLHHHQRA